MTTSLTINDIPDYLTSSELYKNMNSNEPFDIPSEYFKKDIIINTFDDLIKYIRILDYWMVTKNPPESYKFILDYTETINIQILNNIFNKNNLIDEIESTRSRNNVNWMNLLRVVAVEAPDKLVEITSKINESDDKISSLFKKLSER